MGPRLLRGTETNRSLIHLLQDAVWECDLENGCFVAYDTADTAKLEQALASRIQEVKVCGGKYEVDLRTMKQKNLMTGFLRNVRRTERVSQSRLEVGPCPTFQQSHLGMPPALANWCDHLQLDR
jgi:hypothetical protein